MLEFICIFIIVAVGYLIIDTSFRVEYKIHNGFIKINKEGRTK